MPSKNRSKRNTKIYKGAKMKALKKVNKVFIKSNNTTNKIFNRYLYSLIPFIILIILSVAWVALGCDPYIYWND